MAKRKKIVLWSIIGLTLFALLIFILGPVLFASIVYPLPDKHRPSIAKWVPQYCSSVPDAYHLLSALIYTESTWKESARSSAGAVGLTQFIPSTAYSVAKRLGVSPFTPNDLTQDPDMAIRFGSYYLCARIGDYRGDVNKALIAYNGGGGAVIAYEKGYPIRGTVAYSNKIQSITRAYKSIYGEWWKNVDLSAVPSPAGTVGNPSSFSGSRLSLVNLSLIDFWKGLLSNQRSTDSDSQLNNLWQDLLPGT